jgi:serine/threonine protein kinase
MKECTTCKSRQRRQSSAGNKEKNKDKINQIVADIPEISNTEILQTHFPTIKGLHADICQCEFQGSFVALKQLRKKTNKNQTFDIQREAALWYQAKHANIVAVLGLAKLENECIGLLMEWADRGNLRDSVEEMNTEEKIKVSLCICEGLAYMHKNKIVHRDLKPQNVLLFGDKTIAKISDFRTSKFIQTMIVCTDMVGTPKYSAPEMMLQGIQVRRHYGLTIMKLKNNY